MDAHRMQTPEESLGSSSEEREALPLQEAALRVKERAENRASMVEARPYLGLTHTDFRSRRSERRSGGEWTWERWGYTSQRYLSHTARTLEMMFIGGLGALLGLGLAALPTLFLGYQSYPYMVLQPLGAALGGLMGAGWVSLRWSRWAREEEL